MIHFLEFTDCYDAYLKSKDSFQPGVYNILKSPDDIFTNPILNVSVYCLQEGWTVIQSRGQFGNPTDYFNKTWAEYQDGFGTPGMKTKFTKNSKVLFHISNCHR